MKKKLLESPDSLKQVNPIWARHETFYPRFGWLKKGFDKAGEDADIFLREDAPVRLGVGKNMVRSIRYWCKAFKVLEENNPTEFGKQLLKDGGWDSFLEDPASLWLLHWNLLKPTCEAAAWYFTFFIFRKVEFSADDLLAELQEWQKTLGKTVVESSLKKDVSCILRMYGSFDIVKSFTEDSIDCPFQELGIIQNAGNSKRYTFKTGAKANLPAEAIVARVRRRLAISTGAACSSGVEAPSHVLRAMNLPDEAIEGSLRIGLGKYTKESEIETAARLLILSCNQMYNINNCPPRSGSLRDRVLLKSNEQS